MSLAAGTQGSGSARVVAALRACHRLRTVPAGLLATAASRCSVISLAAGETAFRLGDASRAAFVVERGRIASRVRSAEGHVLDVGFAGPGELFGYFEVFDAGPRDSDAVALEPSSVVEIPHALALRLLSSGTGPLLEVIGDLLRIVRVQNRAALDRHTQPVPVRLAALLLELADARGRVVLDGPQTLLAQRVGTARQTLSKHLHDFAADGLITVQDGGRRIVIMDRRRLRGRGR